MKIPVFFFNQQAVRIQPTQIKTLQLVLIQMNAHLKNMILQVLVRGQQQTAYLVVQEHSPFHGCLAHIRLALELRQVFAEKDCGQGGVALLASAEHDRWQEGEQGAVDSALD